MDHHQTLPQETCLVVHDNLLVAEDLRDLLTSEGAHDVIVARDVASIVGQQATAVFISGRHDEIASDPATRDWIARGVPVIVLNGYNDIETRTDGVFVLNQPFKSQQVVALVRKLGLFRAPKEPDSRPGVVSV